MKPIIFSTEMVQAILDGRKTQTRRVIKPQPVMDTDGMWHRKDCRWMDGGLGFPKSGIDDYARYQPGDILWVRETWNCLPIPEPLRGTSKTYWYKADDGNDMPENKWRPSIHMPREAARLFLRVTGVRVERVQDIGDEDAKAEGVNCGIGFEEKMLCSAVDRYRTLWDGINDKRGYSWESNPRVWAYEFERIRKEEAEVE